MSSWEIGDEDQAAPLFLMPTWISAVCLRITQCSLPCKKCFVRVDEPKVVGKPMLDRTKLAQKS